MIGKGSEIRAIEVETRNINAYMKDNPNDKILDIKYQIVQDTANYQGGSYALIIYKEGESA